MDINIDKNKVIKRTAFIILFTIMFSTILVFLQYGKLPQSYFIILIVAIIIIILSVTIGFSYRNNKLIKKSGNNWGYLQIVFGIILVIFSLILFLVEQNIKFNDFYSLILGIILIIVGFYQIKKKNTSK